MWRQARASIAFANSGVLKTGLNQNRSRGTRMNRSQARQCGRPCLAFLFAKRTHNEDTAHSSLIADSFPKPENTAGYVTASAGNSESWPNAITTARRHPLSLRGCCIAFVSLDYGTSESGESSLHHHKQRSPWGEVRTDVTAWPCLQQPRRQTSPEVVCRSVPVLTDA